MARAPTEAVSGRPSFEMACSLYASRYTAQHVPLWVAKDPGNGKFYAPHFATDREWYENTLFPGEREHFGPRDCCFTTGQTWPFGQWLSEPFRKDDLPPRPAPEGPRVGLTFDHDGHAHGVECKNIHQAADCIASWVRDIDPTDVLVDLRVSIEILPEDGNE